MDLKKRTAFTLAEMMVVLLVLSLIMAAFLPVITRRTRQTTAASGEEIWQWADNTTDIFWNGADSSGAVIGLDKFDSGAGDNARLLINTFDNAQNDVLFKENGTLMGRMMLNSGGNLGLGDLGLARFHSTAVGIASIADENHSTAVGYKAAATLDGAAVNTDGYISTLGQDASGTFSYTTAIGAETRGGAIAATAVGYGSEATGMYSTAVGTVANKAALSSSEFSTGDVLQQTIASGLGSTALGVSSVASGDADTAVGARSEASGGYSTAVGPGTTADHRYSVSLGYHAQAIHHGSVAIGANSTGGRWATTTADDQIMLGTWDHSVYIPGSLHIGQVGSGPFVPASDPDLKRAAGSGGIYWTSDRRLKNVKGESKIGLNEIRQIEVDDFTFKADGSKTPQIGVIAQDLQKVFPNSVSQGPDKYLSISQNEMFYAMLNSIKQLDGMFQGWVKDFKALVARIQMVEDKVIALIKVDQINSDKIKSLEAKNKSLEARLAKLEKQAK